MTNNTFKQTEIGEIPEDWKIVRLGEVADVTKLAGYEYTKYVKYSPDGEIIALRALNLKGGVLDLTDIQRIDRAVSDFLIRSKLFKGDILLSYTGTIGNFAIIDEDDKYHLAPNVSRIRIQSEEALTDFIYQYFRTHQFQTALIEHSHGSTQPTVPMKNIREILIPLPPPDEQQQIASILSSLDDKIELNRRMNKTLEEMGKALFKRWFVDFEFPNENGEPYKSSGGEMVESELGEMPKGWEVITIDKVCNTYGGGTPSTKNDDYWRGGNILWATPTDITALKSPILFDTSRKITKEGLNNSSAKLLPAGTILLTSRATVGLLAISDMPITTNQGFIAIECKSLPSNYYMYFELLNRQHEIINKATGSTFREISRSTFRSLNLALPSKKLHDTFNSFASSVFEQIRVNSLENQYLSSIRDSLLPRLMSGKIRVN